MKTFSFFSAKGGTGKTTFNMLFASYLSYVKGQKVFFLDFDAPEYNCFFTRDRELKAGAASDGLFEICCVEDQSRQNIANISAMLKSLEGEVDYVIMDFPGSFNKSDAVCQLALSGAIDLVVIPVDLDEITLNSGKALSQTLDEFGQNSFLFFNRVQWQHKQEVYAALTKWFADKGIKVSGNQIKATAMLTRDSDKKTFMRSTVTFPTKAVESRNPNIINLFEEVIGYEGTKAKGDPDVGHKRL